MFFTNEAERRKNRSISILKQEKVPFIKHLPVIETEEEITLRTKEEICNRAICIALIAAKAEGLEDDIFKVKTREYKVEKCFSCEEKAFTEMQQIDDKLRAKFTWRYEALWVLLWSLGYIKNLDRPDKICDVQTAVSTIVNRERDKFILEAQIRSKKEILDQTDLHFRYHWATTEARLRNQIMPSDLDPDVIYERHYALNWIINYDNEGWDDVSTNT
ncbi:DUF4272 domain-containing protein [Clostridium omnivorum]|uniref:DUF4272 domain-containing protein n=1 Tax=Clostridium omnivorum TaxID=1604902 RepID=A0ABQ5N7Q2_9CLOT|nr:DUF4272 domain-containing protein [Clostridium sp. E14]GLC31205.1 hypothetical protein bsdE14_26150 [Clostridium sp. E14]